MTITKPGANRNKPLFGNWSQVKLLKQCGSLMHPFYFSFFLECVLIPARMCASVIACQCLRVGSFTEIFFLVNELYEKIV